MSVVKFIDARNPSIDALNAAVDHFLSTKDFKSYKKVKHILLLLDTGKYAMAEVALENASSEVKNFLTNEMIVGDAAAGCFLTLHEDKCRACKKCGS